MLRAVQEMDVPNGDPMAVVCSHVLAPALGAFTHWLLEQAKENGVRRLYFLARDGYFFYHAARIFCEAYRLPMECRYLSCSRYSLRLPLFHLDREEALDAVCRGGMSITPEKLLSRAGLNGEEREEVLRILNLPYARNDAVPFAALTEIRKRLKDCGAFLSYMDRHSREAFPNLCGYLKQEGLCREFPDAVVDSGWTGSMQKSLNEALACIGRGGKIEGYYWGLYELPDGVNPSEYHSYYFAPEGNLREKIRFNNCLFEAVYTAPHGMTLGYRKEGETFVPCYGSISPGRRAFIERTGRYLMDYIRRLSREGWGPPDLERDRHTLRKLLDAFMGNPSPQEAAVFGNLSFSDDVLEGGEQPIAAPLSEEELKANHALHKLLVMSGVRKGSVRESAWYEGSAVRNGRHVGRHLRQNTLYQILRYGRKILRARKQYGGEKT